MVKNVLFVCTGNTCRSVMAETILRKEFENRGITGITVGSAGVAASPEYRIFGSLLKVMEEENLDVSSHVSTQVTREMIKNAGLVLAMERRHREILNGMVPRAKEKIHTLKEYAGAEGSPDIDDPIGMPEEVYRRTRDEIRGYIEKIIPMLIKKRS